jgi:hypothetical protein
MKNVYYEQAAQTSEIEKITFESKNFTIYRSIEPYLQEPYVHGEKFNCFTPIAVR